MDLIKYFLEEIKNEGIISEKTIEFYKSDLNFFNDFLENPNLEKITQEELNKYLQYVKEKYSENSVIRKITSLKSFYKFLVKKDIISVSPIDKISTSRKDIKIQKSIKENQLKAIIDVCEDNKIENRDKIIIKLLALTGAKIIDILSINLSKLKENDFKYFPLKQRNIFVMVMIPEELSLEIKDYVEKYNLDQEFLFDGVNNQTFKVNFVKYVKRANLDENILPSMIKNKFIHDIKKIENETENNDIELFKKIKEQYMKIGIGDDIN